MNRWEERVALRIHDAMTADGVTPDHAALIGQAALRELQRDPGMAELFVIRQVDSFGHPHAVVVRRLPPGDALPLYRFDIRRMGRAARQARSEQLRVEQATNNAGAEI